MNRKSKIILQVCRYLLAVVFTFSGFVKGVDPWGSAYKFTDYFIAFNLDFLEPLSLFFSIALSTTEFLIGLMLFLGIRPRLAAWGAFLFMIIFTPLTFVLAVFNPVSDCGCFGDAIKLTNWETFIKNLFFLAAALFLFIGRSSFPCKLRKWDERISFVILIIIALLPSWYGYKHLPLLNFRPYKIGVNISEAMKIPDGSPADVYKTTFFYQKDGVVQEFDESNYPWQDSTWQYVDSKSVLVKKGFTPEVQNFNLYSLYGNELTDSIINKKGYHFMVISVGLDKINDKTSEQLNKLCLFAKQSGYDFTMVTSSTEKDISTFISRTGASFPFINADEVLLKTIIRSNPGLMLMYNGTIIGKWHYNDIPSPEYFQGDVMAKQLKQLGSISDKRLIYLLVSLLLLVIFVKRLPY